ncbi:MAG: zinc metallopeptidase [Bacteroidetes bacterium]|nr:zinc metallopeptidase [Bacteroidota bacterium]
MEWKGREQSTNVEDRRRSTGKTVGGIGCLGTVIMLLLVWMLGGDPLQVLQQVDLQPQQTQQNRQPSAEEDELAQFVSVVLKDTEDVWSKIFREKYGREYVKPTLVMFTGTTQSGCGYASSQTGPFYCPADSKLYIDLGFYQELKNKFKAPGDFAMAYVIAHEVGHHVQNLLGIQDQVQSQRRRMSETQYNKLSVRVELQADFFAGVWAHYDQKMKNILEPGDIEEALNAANSIGDDRLQKQAQGYVVPDAFTHGTSEQRMRWFKKGFDTGDVSQGNTFAAGDL